MVLSPGPCGRTKTAASRSRRVERAALRSSALTPDARWRPNREPNLAARIERKLDARVKRATVHVDGESGRVQLMLQKSGSRMRVIAICSKRLEARVAQAIDEARCMLVARGVIAESSVKGVEECK